MVLGQTGGDCLSSSPDNFSRVDLKKVGGFQGRPSKDADTCYSFWIGGSLKLLGSLDFVDKTGISTFVMTCQFIGGGFSKVPDTHPDLLHAYYSVCWLSMAEQSGLKALDCSLGIPVM